MARFLSAAGLLLTLFLPSFIVSAALLIASDTFTIEHTPARIAAEDYYDGEAEVVEGGIAALLRRGSNIDLGTNAEIPSLRNYGTNRNLRIIFTVTESYYRIVSNRKLNITSLADLKGKRIGSLPGTTAAFFAQKFLATAGVTNFTITNGGTCVRAPCGASTLPAQLARGAVDAIALWEPTPQLAVDLLGEDAVIFHNRSLYREIVNLHSTAERLADPAKRKEIVAFVRALMRAQEDFRTKPEATQARVAEIIGAEASLMKSVWPIHGWVGHLAPDLYDVLREEDPWTAEANRRERLTDEQLATLIDRSIMEEAMKPE
jgi:sulfonate transport system substrate-binding protein